MRVWYKGFILALLVFILAACAPAAPEAIPTFAPTHTPTPVPTLPSGVIRGLAYADESYEQTLTLHLPDGRHPSAPVIFFPYGGYFTAFIAYFNELGVPVISVNVRNDNFQVEMQDSFCALAFIHDQAQIYGLDPTRIVAVGGSMGGGSAALLASINDPSEFMGGCEHTLPQSGRVAAVVALAGVFDYSIEEDFFQGFYGNIRDYMSGTLEDNPETWELASAINHIDGSEPGFLLLHGTADINVNQHQSEIFAAALEQAGVEVELLLMPGLDHSGVIQSRAVFAEIDAYLTNTFP
jgi:dipeptidyl aminopeptidase/acylaminoacyl peptidase